MAKDGFTREERKQLKNPDSFVQGGQRVLERFAAHPRVVASVLGGALIATLAWYGLEQWSARSSSVAWDAYHVAFSKKEGDERWASLEKVGKDYASTRAGFLATAQLGDHWFNEASKEVIEHLKKSTASSSAPKVSDETLEKARKSAGYFKSASEFGGLLPEERQWLRVNQAKALEIAGDLEGSLSVLNSAVTLSKIGGAYALLELGRMYAVSGQKEKATETYTRLVTEFPENRLSADATSALRRLNGKLLAP